YSSDEGTSSRGFGLWRLGIRRRRGGDRLRRALAGRRQAWQLGFGGLRQRWDLIGDRRHGRTRFLEIIGQLGRLDGLGKFTGRVDGAADFPFEIELGGLLQILPHLLEFGLA